MVENGQDEHDGKTKENSEILKGKVGPEIVLNIVEFGKLLCSKTKKKKIRKGRKKSFDLQIHQGND